MRIELIMNKSFIVAALLLKFPACSDKGQQLDDGKFITNTDEYRDYRLELQSFLTNPDSMKREVLDPILPPVKAHDFNVDQDTLVTGETVITIKTNKGGYVTLKDIIVGGDGFYNTYYSLKAFDSKNQVAYILEKKKDGYFRVFGVSVETGNQFTVYQSSVKNRNQFMYEWTFSPDQERLLKTGDIDQEIYGWSLTDVKTGIESKVSFERYREFIIKPMWINKDQFKYTYIEIPFMKGQYYNKGYEYFYSLMNQNPMAGIKLKYDYLYSEDYVLDRRGYIVSQKTNTIQYKADI
jgi:hypothetical protein